MSKSDTIVGHASHHTIKKFELIEEYVKGWAPKLLNIEYCQGIVFIDCMSNSGEYIDNEGNSVFGTPVRTAKYLHEIAWQYPHKQIDLFFSDLSEAKTNHLKSLMPSNSSNFHIHITPEDGNELAKRIGQNISNKKHYLLVYDPYDADVKWEALIPFINSWSEIILNHMVSDPVRAIRMVKKQTTREKYESTYLMEFEELIPYGSKRELYEKRIEEIIEKFRYKKDWKYYIAAFPFFNKNNGFIYDLLLCTSNIEGFELYKTSAWKTFGGKSSLKNTHGSENQLVLDFEGTGSVKTFTDEFCFYVKDIAEYLQKLFRGQSNVPLDSIWAKLKTHPIFPSKGFRQEIKDELKRNHGARIGRDNISFAYRS